MTPSWISTEMAALARAYTAGRLPHALLLHEAPGSGGNWLSDWIAQLVLCQHPERAPCRACSACAKVSTAQHPDLVVVQPEEESTQLRIEQVRSLSEELALTSHQGSYKVAILRPADAMNRFAANALLKTLEEPSPKTLIVLVASQPSRLPATILSRCQRVRVRAPTRQEALAWLQGTRGPGDWKAVLDVLGEAPMLAADLDPAGVAQISSEVRKALDEAVAGTLDPVATAERWARSELPLRVRNIENWLTDRVRRAAGEPGFFTKVGAGPYLSGPQPVLNMRDLFELVDGVRELKSALDTPINRGLMLETLLRRFTPRRGGAARASGR